MEIDRKLLMRPQTLLNLMKWKSAYLRYTALLELLTTHTRSELYSACFLLSFLLFAEHIHIRILRKRLLTTQTDDYPKQMQTICYQLRRWNIASANITHLLIYAMVFRKSFFARSSSPSKRCRHSVSVLRLSKYSTHNKYSDMFCFYLDLFLFIITCGNNPNCKSLEQIDNCFISRFYCLR